VKKVSLFQKNILYYMGMGEEQTKSEEDRFEDGLRQILSGGPSSGARAAVGNAPVRPAARSESVAGGTPDNKAEAQTKALFWFKLIRPLAALALAALLAMFVMRITAER